MDFNIPLISAYKRFVRERGLATLSHEVIGDKEIIPTPVLSRRLYEKNSQRGIELSSLIKAEEEKRVKWDADQNAKIALETLKKVWPDFFSLCQKILEYVTERPEGMGFESWSDPKNFGEFTFSFSRTSVLDWVEIIVHEVTHLYQFGVTAQPKFKEKPNLKEKRYSAIRKTERPLIGIYHGTCVEANIVIICDLLLKSRDHNLNIDEIKEKKNFFVQKFMKDFSVIEGDDIHTFDPHTQKLMERALSISMEGQYVH